MRVKECVKKLHDISRDVDNRACARKKQKLLFPPQTPDNPDNKLVKKSEKTGVDVFNKILKTRRRSMNGDSRKVHGENLGRAEVEMEEIFAQATIPVRA